MSPVTSPNFGNSNQIEFDTLTVNQSGGSLNSCKQAADEVTIGIENVYQAFDDISSTLQVCVDKVTGKQFEVGITNSDATSDKADLEISGFPSSISGGNTRAAIEFAQHSAIHTDKSRIYVAAFGSGGSSYWDEAERKYITQTGRFTQESGEPLPTISALSRVLQRLGGLTVSRLSANSASCAYATALMGALPEGQVSHAYFRDRGNISNHPTRLAWGIGRIIADQFNEKISKEDYEDQRGLTSEIVTDARTALASIYSNNRRIRSPRPTGHVVATKRLYSEILASSKGGFAHNFPATIDTAQVLKQQPDAKLTYHFPEKSNLKYNIRRHVAAFLIGLQRETNELVGSNPDVEALIMPGTHHDHSQYPTLRWAIEKYAFDR